MKGIFTILIIIILLITGSLYGQIATYTGSGGTSTAVTGYPNEVVGSLQNIGFGSNTPCGSGGLSGKTVSTTWTSYNTTGPHYYIQITPNSGYQLNVTGISAGMRISNTGPSRVRYAYSLDNGATWIDDGTDHVLSNPGCGSSVASSWSGGTLPTGISSTTTGIIVAVFPFLASNSSGTFQLNYLNVLGTVAPGCTPPTISISPAVASFCAGTGGITLTASGAGTSGTYSWSPATGLSAPAAATTNANPALTTVYTATGYSSPTCSNTTTLTVTVNPLPNPAPITGAASVCVGASTTLSNATTGGVWSITNPVLATVNTLGMVTGIAAGIDTVQYAVTNACGTTTVIYPITINPLPVGGTITGPDSVCVGATIALANATATTGGVWSSLNTAVATASGGTVGGVLADTTTIKYSVTTSCGTAIATHLVVVKALPFAGAISGPDSVCFGTSISLTASVPGGIWNTSNSSVASVSPTGIVTGTSAALATTSITYTVSTFSCGSATATYAVTSRPQPFAGTITGAASVCLYASTTLASTATGGTFTTNAPGTASATLGGIISGASIGTAIITYTVTNSCGTATDTAIMLVNPLPPAITGPANVCVAANVVLANTLPAGTWSSSDATIATIDASGTAYGVSPGTAIITYTNSATGCYITTPLVANFSVPASVSITASTPASVCAGTVVTYTAHPVNGGTSPLYVWSINGVILSGASSHTYTPADNDIVRCWIISSLGCAVPDTASDVIVMTVHHIATPLVAMTTGMGDTVCQGALTTVTALPVDGGTAPTYQWYVNTIPVAMGSTYSFVPANGDVVSLIMNSNEFCRTADQAFTNKTLTVSPYLLPLVATTINPGLVSCELYPVDYTASQINGGTMPTYQWSVNGVSTTTGNVFSYIPANGDVVQVQLTSNFPCVSTPTAVSTSAMTVVPVVQPIGIVNAEPGYIINAGAYDTFTVTLISGGGMSPTFQWYKNNVPVAGATNTTYITNELITGDSINCIVTNTDQCSGVSVFNYVTVTIGNNVGVNSVSMLHDIALYPNPNNGSFSLSGKLEGLHNADINIEVTDMVGRTVYITNAAAYQGTINAKIDMGNNIAAGQYLVKLTTSSGVEALHFIVNR